MRIDLLGSSFTIQSDEDPAYLQRVVDYFSGKVDEVRRSVGTSDPLKISILAGILASDECMKAKAESLDPEVSRITNDLIARLDASLDDVFEADESVDRASDQGRSAD